ncbi:hypothetical protein QCE73_37320 [Caballeronia sp. LZ029]|uniref:hypothetical protein n=1 Tax=Caballeronia sp. LZ029 TaxID=3038564 RepID=UPI00285E5248|nr:hypothetical protein [Caballeronia sp. LZ029]MDR5748843.1 hypothetical protein [Caballeronia sp. LZ029]
MSDDMVQIIRAIVKDQLLSLRTLDLAVVTSQYPHESQSDNNNYACDLELRDSGLELKKVPLSTGRVGAVAIPNKDDVVLVQYLGGDLQSPVVTGRVYTDANRSPVAKAGECVYVSSDDPASGVRRAYLEFPNGNKLTLDDDTLRVEMGSTTVTVNHDGDIEIVSEGNLKVQTEGDTTIEATGDLSLSASGDLKLEGTNVSLKASANATVEGSAGATVKGAAVKVAGQISFAAA